MQAKILPITNEILFYFSTNVVKTILLKRIVAKCFVFIFSNLLLACELKGIFIQLLTLVLSIVWW